MEDKKNWVDEILEATSKMVQEWPEWMRRPEVRAPESLIPPIDEEKERKRIMAMYDD